MAKKASTLSKAMPTLSNVSMCPQYAGRDMAKSMYTQENGSYSFVVSARQPNVRKYGYQVMYRTRTKDATTGEWGAWSSYMNANAFALTQTCKTYNVGAGLPFPAGATTCAKNSTVSSAYWLGSNRGYATKSDYRSLVDGGFSGTLNQQYAAIQYGIAVRTYSKTKVHGSWAYGTLTVNRRAAVYSEKFYRSVNGGIYMECNVSSAHALGSFTFESIVDGDGNELLSGGSVTVASKANAHPATAPSSSMTAILVTIPLAQLSRAVKYGENLRVDGYYKSQHGVKTTLNTSIRVSDMDVTMDEPQVRATYDEATGELVVKAARSDSSDVIGRASCTASYTIGGKSTTVKPTSVQKAFDSTLNTDKPFAEWRFCRFPMGVDVKISVTVGAKYGASSCTVSATKNIKSDSFVLNGVTYPRVTAALRYDQSFSQTVTGNVDATLPWGSALPFASLRSGRSNEVVLSGTATGADIASWEELASKGAGVYDLRTPMGHVMRVAVSRVVIKRTSPSAASITATMTEVR